VGNGQVMGQGVHIIGQIIMKKKLLHLGFLVFIATVSHSQKVKYIGLFELKNKFDTETGTYFFKIGKDTFSFSNTDTLFVNSKKLITWSKDSSLVFEVLDEKYIIGSYYPSHEVGLAFGPRERLKGKIVIINSKSPYRRWFFDLKFMFNSSCIVGFDEKKGELKLTRTLTGTQ
jgi:hypothetical protein